MKKSLLEAKLRKRIYSGQVSQKAIDKLHKAGILPTKERYAEGLDKSIEGIQKSFKKKYGDFASLNIDRNVKLKKGFDGNAGKIITDFGKGLEFESPFDILFGKLPSGIKNFPIHITGVDTKNSQDKLRDAAINWHEGREAARALRYYQYLKKKYKGEDPKIIKDIFSGTGATRYGHMPGVMKDEHKLVDNIQKMYGNKNWDPLNGDRSGLSKYLPKTMKRSKYERAEVGQKTKKILKDYTKRMNDLRNNPLKNTDHVLQANNLYKKAALLAALGGSAYGIKKILDWRRKRKQKKQK